MLNRLAHGALAMVAATAIVGGGVQAAEAHYVGKYIGLDSIWDRFPEETGGCHGGYFCTWFDENAAVSGVGWYNTDWNWGDPSRPAWVRDMNNDAESWKNNSNSGNDVQVYDVPGGSGANVCIQTGVYVAYVGGMANIVSTHVFRSSC